MEELRGKQGTWRIDGESVSIRYDTGRRADPLLKALAQCDVPLEDVASVRFAPGGDGKSDWHLRLLLPDRADPFIAAGVVLSEQSHPLSLTGTAGSELLAEYYAGELTRSVEALRESTESRTAGAVAVDVVPTVPLHIRTTEGAAVFDGTAVRLVWSGEAGGRKKKAQRREFDLDDVRQVEWVQLPGWHNGYLRIVPRDGAAAEPPTKPAKDLCCLVTENNSGGGASSLLFAATVTAHLWAGAPEHTAPLPVAARGETTQTQPIYDRIRELGRLHGEGLLTDEEFQAKKAELLARL